MAGAVGVVRNQSVFSSFVVRRWEQWMTECVLLHMSGVSIPELRVRFGKTDTHLRNILNTDQANRIISEINKRAIQGSANVAEDQIRSIKSQALGHLEHFMKDEVGLRESRAFSFWDSTRKTLETVSKMEAPQSISNNTLNIQQNFINSNPELIERLRSAPSLIPIEVTANVEYLGAPPSAGQNRQVEVGVLAGRDDSTPSEGKNRLTLLSSGSYIPDNP